MTKKCLYEDDTCRGEVLEGTGMCEGHSGLVDQPHDLSNLIKTNGLDPMVHHPDHYGGESDPYEHIKVVDAWDLNYRLGNCTKYICRAGKKPGVDALQDLRKAQFYLNSEIERLERGE